MKKEYLFSYGTLQYPEVQMDALRRILDGVPDELSGFQITKLMIDGEEFPTLIPGNESVHGTLYEVKHDEFIVLDEFETKAYKRIKVTLKGGQEAWVYVKNDEL